jgi:hypothetical protein
MVRGEDHQRIAGESPLVQHLEQAPNLRVDDLDHGRVVPKTCSLPMAAVR